VSNDIEIQFPKKIGPRILLLSVSTSIVAIFTAGWVALAQVKGTSEKTATATVEPVKAEVETLKLTLKEHIKDAGENTRRTDEKLHEAQMDIRALYKAVMTGQRQPRLEKPPEDGGQ